MARRSGKFYYKNESEVMELLGMKQVPGSGNGWVAKEDGENENVLCQLKSTDAASISVKKLDIDKLLVNSTIEHKLPVFAIQFLKSNDIFLLVRPMDLPEVSKYLNTGIVERHSEDDLVTLEDEGDWIPTKVVKSSQKAREKFEKQEERKWKKKGKSAL